MAKRWDPEGKPLGPQERVGRRLFDLPELVGATEDQYFGSVKVTQFWDKHTGEVSLDRLGRSSVEPKVRTYLVPRAEDLGASFKPKRRFDGWAHIKAQDLSHAKWPPRVVINASPVFRKEGEDDVKENIYHAHIDRPEDAYILASHLRNLFENSGDIETYRAADALERDSGSREGAMSRIVSWLSSFLKLRRD